MFFSASRRSRSFLPDHEVAVILTNRHLSFLCVYPPPCAGAHVCPDDADECETVCASFVKSRVPRLEYEMHSLLASRASWLKAKSNARRRSMRKMNVVVIIAVALFASSFALGAGLISKQAAEKDALKAVGGGTVVLAALDSVNNRRIWSVDITGRSHEYEVWVDAHTGSIVKVITQPLNAAGFIPMAQAEQTALAAVSGSELLQSTLGSEKNDRREYKVDVLGAENEYEVSIDAHSGTLVKIVTTPLEAMATAAGACRFITQAKADKIALAAVGANKVLLSVLDKTDTPPNWSVDVVTAKGAEYEVKVNACTGKVVAIIVGG